MKKLIGKILTGLFVVIVLAACSQDYNDQNGIGLKPIVIVADENLDKCIKDSNQSTLDIKDLNCVQYDIKLLNGLESLSNLSTLNLSGNNIDDLTPLVNLLNNQKSRQYQSTTINSPLLSYIDLSNNQIENASPLQRFSSSTDFILNGNPLSELSAPADVKVFMGDGELTVRWQPVPGALGYRIYASSIEANIDDAILETTANAGRYVIENLDNAIEQFIKISAVYVQGEGVKSAVYRAQSRVATQEPTEPAIAFMRATDTSVYINWIDVDDAAFYSVSYQPLVDADKSSPVITEKLSPPAVISGLTPATTYQFTILVENAVGVGASKKIAITTTQPKRGKPFVQNLSGVSESKKNTLNWELSTAYSQYSLYYSVDKSATKEDSIKLFERMNTDPDFSIKGTFTHDLLDVDTTYHYLLIANYDNGNTVQQTLKLKTRLSLSELVFEDEALKSCILQSGYVYVNDVKIIRCHNKGIVDLSGLSNFVQLKFLDLSNNLIQDITPVTSLINLVDLNLQGNLISRMPSLDKLTRLETLQLQDNEIKNLDAISGLSNLSGLGISANPISDLNGFTLLTNLKRLQMSRVFLTSISSIEMLTQLTHLTLADNRISDISVLANFPDLQYLDVSDNFISDFSVLDQLSRITYVGKTNNILPNIVSENIAPVVDAYVTTNNNKADEITLNGDKTYDEDNDKLQYEWVLVSSPEQSSAVVQQANQITAAFIADVPGEYAFKLNVNDGLIEKESQLIVFQYSPNQIPVANAGENIVLKKSGEYLLDASLSNDAENNSLSYQWMLLKKPTGSSVVIQDANKLVARFTPDIRGEYQVGLIVNDGVNNSIEDVVTIQYAINRKPTANAGGDINAITLGAVQLNAVNSSDPDMDALTYQWQLVNKPANSLTELSSTTSSIITLTPDVKGDYVVQLVVNDGQISSEINSVVVRYRYNAPPVFISISPLDISLNEDFSMQTLNLVASDVDKEMLTWSIVNSSNLVIANLPPNGVANQNQTEYSNSLTISSLLNLFGDDSITIRVTDPGGASASLVVNLKINPINDAPQFDSAPVTTALGAQAYTYTVNVSDEDSPLNSLVIAATTLPNWLSLVKSDVDGAAVLSGNVPSNVTSYPVVLTVSDGDSSLTPTEQSFTISIGQGLASAINSTALVADGVAGIENVITIQAKDLNGTDMPVGGEAVSTVVDNGSENLLISTVDNGDGTYTARYTPKIAGTHQITISMSGVIINNGTNYVSEVVAGATIAIATQAQVPATGAINTTTLIQIQTFDGFANPRLTQGSDSVTVAVAGANTVAQSFATHDSSNPGTYTFSYIPKIGGVDNIEIKVNGIAIAPVFVSVVSNNSPKFITTSPATVTMIEDGVFSFPDIVASDADNELLTWEISSPATLGNASVSASGVATGNVGEFSNSINYSADTDKNGTDSFTVQVTDATGASVNFVVNVQIDPVNDAAKFTSQPTLSGRGAETYRYSIAVSDIDSPVNNLVISASVLPTWLSLQQGTSANAATLTGVAPSIAANYSVTLLVSDGDSSTPATAQSFVISVATSLVSPADSTAIVDDGIAGQTTNIEIVARDALGNVRLTSGDASKINISISGANAAANVSSIVAKSNAPGYYLANYIPANAGQDIISITILDTNLTPIAISGNTFTSVVTPAAPLNLSVSLNGSFADLSWPTISGLTYNVYRSTTEIFSISNVAPIATGLTGGAYQDVSIAKGQQYYFVITANLNLLESAASNKVSIINLNVAPKFINAVGADLPGPLVFDVSLNTTSGRSIDLFAQDSDAISWSISTPPTKGAAAFTVQGTGSTNTVVYTPTSSALGADSFTIGINDGFGGTDSLIINIAISPNTPPIATILSPLLTQNLIVGESINFSASASDLEDDAAGIPLKFNWTFLGATNINDIPFLNPGNITFNDVIARVDGRLTVMDRHGASTSVYTSPIRVRNAPVVDLSSKLNNLLLPRVSAIEQIKGIRITSTNQLIVATHGYPSGFNSDVYFRRLDINGIPDTTFGTNGLIRARPVSEFETVYTRDMILDSNDNILVLFNSGAAAEIWRFNSAGVRDTSYGTSGVAVFPGTKTYANKIIINPDDTIYVTGREEPDVLDSSGNKIGTNRNLAVWKFDGSTGLVDQNFANSGKYTFDGTASPNTPDEGSGLLFNQGKLLVSGSTIGPGSNYNDLLLIRLNTLGIPDTTFGNAGIAIVDSRFIDNGIEVSGNDENAYLSNGMAVDNSNRILIASTARIASANPIRSKVILWRFSSIGVPDINFGTRGDGSVIYDTYVRDPDLGFGTFDRGYGTGVRVNSNNEIMMTGVADIRNRKLIGIWFYDDNGLPLSKYARNGVLLSKAGVLDDIGSVRELVISPDKFLIYGLNRGYNYVGYTVPFRFK